MRAPQTRREKEIWHACDELWLEHQDFKKLTGDALRDRLLELDYKKGSPNEIYRYRKSWQENKGVLGSGTASPEAEAALPDPLNRAVSLVREEIFTEAKQEIEKITLSFAEERAQMEAALQKAAGVCEALQAEVASATKTIHTLEAHCSEQAQKEAQLQQSIERLNQRILDGEKALEAQEYETRLNLEKLRLSAEHQTQMEQEAEKQLALVQATARHDYQKLLESLEARHQEQGAQHREEQKALRDLMESQRHQWLALLDEAKTENHKLTAHNQKISSERDRQHTLLQQLEERVTQYEALLELQHLQASLLKTVSEDVKKLEKIHPMEKIQHWFEQQSQQASKYIQASIQTQFQQQNELLLQYVKECTLTPLTPHAVPVE